MKFPSTGPRNCSHDSRRQNAPFPLRQPWPRWWLLALALLGAAALQAQPQYSIVNLGTLGGASSDAFGLNEHGDVVGQAQTGTSSNFHAFLYRNGTVSDLGTLPGGTFSVASAINAHGQAVGYSTQPSGAQRAVLFADGSITPLAPIDAGFAGNDSAALGIDDDGRIVGYSKVAAAGSPGGIAHAFLFAEGSISDLGLPYPATDGAQPDATALAITGSGMILGRTVDTASLVLPAMGWIFQDGAMRLLPLPPDPAYNAIELADGNSGSLVGTAISLVGGGPRPPERGFILDPVASTYTFIEPLPGDTGTNARGINAAGDVVGNSFDALRQRAILHASGVTIDLNTCVTLDGSGFVSLDIARRINGRGQIIGVGTTTSGNRRAFLLTPLMPTVSDGPSGPSETAADPLPVSITFSDLVHTYDGATHVATIASDPSLPIHGDPSGTLIVYYNDRTAYGLASGPSGAPYALYPSHPGDHAVRVDVYSNDQRYAGSATATLRIVPAPVSVSLEQLNQAYDGSPKLVDVTCTPATAVRPEGAGIEPMSVELTYDGRATPPTEPGLYKVVATVKNYGYTGTATGTLTVTAPEEPPPPAPPVAVTPAEPPAPPAPDTPLEPTGRAGSPRLVNVSSRGHAGANGDPLIAGFVIDGDAPQQVLVRAVGPSLTGFGVTDPVMAPRLTLYRGDEPIAHNDRWGSAADASTLAGVMDAVGAFGLSDGSADAALLAVLEPGAYTAVLTNADAKSGGALIEIYDASNGSSRLVNLSTRGHVGPGDRALISGLVVNGPSSKRMLIRAVGPGLAGFGVTDPLPSPNIRIMAGGELVVAAGGWGDNSSVADAASAAGAFPLAPGSRDAALVVTLPAGAYTAVVGSESGETGSVLLEIYELPSP